VNAVAQLTVTDSAYQAGAERRAPGELGAGRVGRDGASAGGSQRASIRRALAPDGGVRM